MSLVPEWLSPAWLLQEWTSILSALLFLVLIILVYRIGRIRSELHRAGVALRAAEAEIADIQHFYSHLPFAVAATNKPVGLAQNQEVTSSAAGDTTADPQRLLNNWLNEQDVAETDNGAGRVVVATPEDSYRIVSRRFKDRSGGCQIVAAAIDIQDLKQTAAAAIDRAKAAESARDEIAHIFNEVPFPIWVRGDNYRIQRCNRDYARIVGASLPEAPAVEIESALTKGQAVSLAEAVRKDGKGRTETRYFVVEGQRRALDIHESVLPGTSIGVGTAHDVTDREEIRAELNRFADAQAEILNNLNTAIVLFGADKTVSFYNSAYARLWRLDEDWLDTHPHHSNVIEAMRERRLLPEQADFPAYKARIMGMYTDLIHTDDGLMYRPDGRILRHLVAAHPLGGLLFIYEDITDRMQLEASYNTMIAVQRETLNSVFEAVAVFGGDGRLKLYNQSYAKMWGFDQSILEGEPHITELVERCREGAFFGITEGSEWQELRTDLIASVTERREQRGRIDLETGQVIEYGGVPLPDGNIVFSYLDVTDGVRIERALRERNTALETADRMKSEFIASVSYELRTPLNVIIGFTEVLEKEFFGPLNARQKEYIHDILQSSQQLLSLINAILDLAVIEAGQLELETESLDVYDLLDSVLGLNRQRARELNLTLEFLCQRDIGHIDADERRVKQILFSLMSNAAKYNRTGGKITVAAQRLASGDVAITVSDTGYGIKQEEQAWMFERFQRGTTKGVRPGAGLGLSLVKSIVELHGGRVELESEEDVGTTVTCILPGRQPAADAAE